LIYRKNVEQFPEINKLCNVAYCWIYIGIYVFYRLSVCLLSTYARTLPTAYSKYLVVLLTLQVMQVQLLLDSLSTHPGGYSCLFTLHFTVQVINQCVYWRTCLFADILQSNLHLLHQETHIVYVVHSSMLVVFGLVRLQHMKGCYKLLVALQDEKLSW